MRQSVTEAVPRISVVVALLAVLLWPAIAQAQTTRLAPEEDTFFGQAVAISADGQRAVVGAAMVNDQGVPQTEGNAYVFVRDESGSWTQEAELVADDAPDGNTAFGAAVAIDGDGRIAVVGSFLDEVGDNVGQGSAYVFTRDETGTWTQEAKLTADDGAPSDRFGFDTAISADGNRVVVGSIWKDVDENPDQGSAYVFTRGDDGSWTQEAQVTGSGTATSMWPNFGETVAIDADGSRLVAGSKLDDISGDDTNEGRAYVFDRGSDGTWTEVAVLEADDAAEADFFGNAVAINRNGDRIVAGSIFQDVDGNMDQGSAYVFTRGDGGSWTQEAQVTGSGTATSMWPNFGETVAIDGDGNRLVAGSKLDDISGDDTNEGRAYVFDRSSNGTWTEVAALTTETPTEADFFGNNVAINGDGSYVLVGSIFNDDPDIGGNNDAGAAYVFGPESLPVDVAFPEAPRQYELSAVYPNPLQGHGTLTLTLRETQKIRLALYNTLGQRVQTLHDGAMQGGTNTLTLDVDGLPSGVYLLKVDSEEYTGHQTIVLAR